MQYSIVGCGGTFDQFHNGHKAFLRFVFSKGEHAVIGVTSDRYVQENKSDVKTPFAIRKKNIQAFLEEEGFSKRATIIQLDDIFGPTVQKDTKIEAIITTEDTKNGVNIINNKRQELGLSILPVISTPLLEKNNISISASSIRNGEMNTEGKQFINNLWMKKTFILPETLREVLHKPFGTLLADINEIKHIPSDHIVTVGDVTTSRLNSLGIRPKISIVDFYVERKKTFQSLHELGFSSKEEVIFIKNPPGMITADVWQTAISLMHTQLEKNFIIMVDGEEDLLVIPFILVLPLDFYIFYGQPHEGMVEIKITLVVKERAYELFKQFHEITTRGY